MQTKCVILLFKDSKITGGQLHSLKMFLQLEGHRFKPKLCLYVSVLWPFGKTLFPHCLLAVVTGPFGALSKAAMVLSVYPGAVEVTI